MKHASSPIDTLRRRGLFAALAFALGLAGCASAPEAPSAAVRSALAPTGTLRIAVYPGSPTSLVAAPGSDEQRGVAVDIGREMARRLGVPAQVVIYPRVAEVVAALQRGEADVTITNATPERMQLLDFGAPLLALELGVLVPAGSPVRSAAAMDQPGARIGVSQGSSSQQALGARLRQATLLPQPTLQAAREALVAGQIDAFATNKAILFELQGRVPGALVAADRWGLEHLALGTGKGRDAGLAWLRQFSAAVQAEGLVQRAAERAGLRGTAAPDPR